MKKLIAVLFDLFKKRRQFIIYCVFGLVTTVVSWLVYSLGVILFRGNTTVYSLIIAEVGSAATEVFSAELEMFILLANTLSWVVAVLVAFATNKVWVFGSRSWRPCLVAREAATFIGGRILTGILEIVSVPLLVTLGMSQTLFGIEGLPAKIIVSVVIVILNYLISKFFAFKIRK